MASFARYVLKDWPEDRLPECGAPSCTRILENGDPYAVLDGTIKMVCLPCALDPYQRNETLGQMATDAVIREREARERRRELAQAQRQKSQRTTQQARTVVVKPPQPRREPRPQYRYPPHACGHCQKFFQPRATRIFVDGQRVQGPQPYCSISCSVRARRADYRLRVCPACDQEFIPKRGDSERPQTCCSRSCARWWFPRGLRNPNPTKVAWSLAWGPCCLACGRSDRKHRGQGYCSRCYRKHRVLGQPRAKEPRAPERSWRTRMERRAYTKALAG